MKVFSEIIVRGYHLDMFRHVNNARYLEFLEEGRWAYLDANPRLFHQLEDAYFFVVNININYRKAATLGDLLVVQTDLSKIGTTSGVMRQEIVNKKTGDSIIDADVTFVIVDKVSRKPLNLSDLLAAEH
jgi:thioesterase-3